MKSYFTKYKTSKLLTMALSFVLFSMTLNASGKDNKKSYETIMMCTYSQEILKDRTMRTMDIKYVTEQQDEVNAPENFHKALNLLQKEKLSKKLHNESVKLSNSWGKIEKRIFKGIKKESVAKIYKDICKLNTSCLNFAHAISNKKHNITKTDIATINLYVHQLTTLYLIKSWDAIPNKEYRKDVKRLIENYDKLQKKINKDKKTSKELQVNFKKIEKAFITFKFITTSESGRYMPMLADKKASDIDVLTKTILKGK
jgi:hypothetical protein